VREGELELAVRLIQELSSAEFRPEKYQDEYRLKVLDMVNLKVEGKEISPAAPEVQRGQVSDLMEALKQSLQKRLAGGRAAARRWASSRRPDNQAATVSEPALVPEFQSAFGKRFGSR
jgi:non-homologous end joining protein Ku